MFEWITKELVCIDDLQGNNESTIANENLSIYCWITFDDKAVLQIFMRISLEGSLPKQLHLNKWIFNSDDKLNILYLHS